MRIGTYTGNIQHNAANECYKDMTMQGLGGYNPNQANPMAAWMSYAYIYFGGEAAVNKVLSTFNFDTMIGKTKQYGWDWITSTFNRSETRRLMTQGGQTGDGRCKVNPMGVRKPFAFNGRIVSGDLAAPKWYDRPGVVPYEPFQILKRSEYEWNLGAKVVDEQALTGGSCGKGHIKPGYKSPHLGKIGMFLEYNIGGRSSSDYVAWGAKISLFHLTTLLATGFWDSGSDGNAVMERYKIAMAVMRYREDNTAWYDTVFCKYHSGFSDFLGKDFANDLFDAFVTSGITWKYAPVTNMK